MALQEKAKAGCLELMYLDEAGFSSVHPNRTAWTPRGEQHLIDATRAKRLNVLGALSSSGYFEDVLFTGAMTSELFVDFLKSLAEKYEKPITFILDNASFHKSKFVQQASESLHKLGVTLKFLPPYCPELNRIEKFWFTVKHRWMKIKCRTHDELIADISEIFDGFGGKYKFDFYAK